MKFQFKTKVLLILFMGSTMIWFLHNATPSDELLLYKGRLISNVKSNLLYNKDWRIKCYLKPYDEQERLPLLVGKSEEDNDPNAYVCYFELEYLGNQSQIELETLSVELQVDWERGDVKFYNGQYSSEEGVIVDFNNDRKYFYLPNAYFTPQYITNLETEMTIHVQGHSELKYYGNMKFKKRNW